MPEILAHDGYVWLFRTQHRKRHQNRARLRGVTFPHKTVVFDYIGSGRRKNKTKKQRQEAIKSLRDDFFSRTGKTMGEAGRDRYAENSSKVSSSEALGRRHDSAARAPYVVVAQFPEWTKARRPAEKLAKEQNKNQRQPRSV